MHNKGDDFIGSPLLCIISTINLAQILCIMLKIQLIFLEIKLIICLMGQYKCKIFHRYTKNNMEDILEMHHK